MVRLTRPGGWVALQDMDWISWTCVPEIPDWNMLAKAAGAAWSGDVEIGRRLPVMLKRRDLSTLTWTPISGCSARVSLIITYCCDSLRSTAIESWLAAKQARPHSPKVQISSARFLVAIDPT